MPVALLERPLRRIRCEVAKHRYDASQKPVIEKQKGILDGSIPITDQMREESRNEMLGNLRMLYSLTFGGWSPDLDSNIWDSPEHGRLASFLEISKSFEARSREVRDLPPDKIDRRIKEEAQKNIDEDTRRKRQGSIFP